MPLFYSKRCMISRVRIPFVNARPESRVNWPATDVGTGVLWRGKAALVHRRGCGRPSPRRLGPLTAGSPHGRDLLWVWQPDGSESPFPWSAGPARGRGRPQAANKAGCPCICRQGAEYRALQPSRRACWLRPYEVVLKAPSAGRRQNPFPRIHAFGNAGMSSSGRACRDIMVFCKFAVG